MKAIQIAEDGLCICDQATPCLIGRVGSQPRCSVDDWRKHIENLKQENKELRVVLEKFLSIAKSQPEDCKNATHFYYLLVEADDLVKEAEQALNKEK